MTWVILNTFVKDKKRRYHQVQCSCGYTGERRADWVDSGRSTECKSCSAKRTASKYPMPVHRTGCGGLSGTHYLSIKSGATKRGLVFGVTPEFLWALYNKQGGYCALSGVPLVLVARLKNQNTDWSIITASVDRIDSTKGYTEDNVQWVHKTVNQMKWDMTQQEFLVWCETIAHRIPNEATSSV